MTLSFLHDCKTSEGHHVCMNSCSRLVFDNVRRQYGRPLRAMIHSFCVVVCCQVLLQQGHSSKGRWRCLQAAEWSCLEWRGQLVGRLPSLSGCCVPKFLECDHECTVDNLLWMPGDPFELFGHKQLVLTSWCHHLQGFKTFGRSNSCQEHDTPRAFRLLLKVAYG